MKMTREMLINFIVVPITLLLVLTVTIILLVVTPKEMNLWRYYLIGSMLGLMTHGMMVKQNARISRLTKADPLFSPKKSARLWFMLRMFLVASILVICALIAKFYEESSTETLVIKLIVALAGYMTLKIVFITTTVLFLLKDNSKNDNSNAMEDNSKMDPIEMASKHKAPMKLSSAEEKELKEKELLDNSKKEGEIE